MTPCSARRATAVLLTLPAASGQWGLFDGGCDTGWIGPRGGEWCFRATRSAEHSFAQQGVACRAMGARVGSFGGLEEDRAVRHAVEDAGHSRVWIPLLCGFNASSPGAERCSGPPASPRGWRWLDGSNYDPADPTGLRWAPGEPSGRNGSCAQYVTAEGSFGAHSEACGEQRAVLCKRRRTLAVAAGPVAAGCDGADIISLDSPLPVAVHPVQNSTVTWLTPPASRTVISLPPAATAPGGWLSGGRLFWIDRARRTVPRGTRLSVTCHSDTCDVYIFIHHQPPTSSRSNGGLPRRLPGEGWTPGARCGPHFWLESEPDCAHPMLAFRRQLDCGETAAVTVDDTSHAAYMAMAAARGVDCSGNVHSSEARCVAAHAGRSSSCQWREGECADRWCSDDLGEDPVLRHRRADCPPPDTTAD
eukprot:TRINITY_DN20632_c0_g1_i1.p1 TRINITY_DN20632_c0_g1~~TRINITY_DN20632_c0_g1_i1.p1  ORF type:complete len:418 (+),score=64.71 TRINITY_DN20632_c0_g1_i1:223-1476(+)